MGHNPDHAEFVSVITIDSLGLDRLDLIKIDAEGMEMEVLQGAEQTIGRCRPVIYAEWLKVGEGLLRERLNGLGYSVRNYPATANFLAVPQA